MSLALAIETVRQPEVVALIAASDAYSAERYPPEGNFGTDLDGLDRPEITFLVARIDGVAVGCGALRVEADGTGELKRIFVSDAARGKGVGRAVMDGLMAVAAGCGLHRLNLETGPLNTEAVAMYRRYGFVACGAFGTYHDNPWSLFMTRDLYVRQTG